MRLALPNKSRIVQFMVNLCDRFDIVNVITVQIIIFVDIIEDYIELGNESVSKTEQLVKCFLFLLRLFLLNNRRFRIIWGIVCVKEIIKVHFLTWLTRNWIGRWWLIRKRHWRLYNHWRLLLRLCPEKVAKVIYFIWWSRTRLIWRINRFLSRSRFGRGWRYSLFFLSWLIRQHWLR